MIFARLILIMMLAIGFVAPARADDISAAGRGVVRVVTIATTDGEVVGFGHGSGFAIAPNRIITNAHVVELAARFPDNVVIGVVPSEGARSYRGRLIAYDPLRDLALIEFTGTQLPALTLYPGPVDDGETVIALGYPGNVDLATAQSAADYIKPLSPVRSQGGYAGRRSLTGIEVLLHTASIARGNSGGPLLDECGRVIGANSAITRAEEGDSSFGFAIADTEIAAFLREAKQPYGSTGAPCTSIAERLKQDQATQADDARASQTAAAQARDQAAAAAAAAQQQRRAERQRLRENIMGLAGLGLVAGAMLVGAAGLLALTGRRTGAIASACFGALMMIGAIILFINRPADATLSTATSPASSPPGTIASTAPRTGPMLCRIVPARSRINTSPDSDVAIDWAPGGCVNGRTQYAENQGKWERILVPADEQTVSVLDYDPATGGYANRRYLLSAATMAEARKRRGAVTVKACAADPRARQQLAAQQASIREILPAQPDEWLVYACSPASAP